MTDDPQHEKSERLREAQAERARQESELAQTSESTDERRAHERRADKAEYLRKKLKQQSESS